MSKQAPSAGKIVTMLVFTLSCVGLLVFLWGLFGWSPEKDKLAQPPRPQ